LPISTERPLARRQQPVVDLASYSLSQLLEAPGIDPEQLRIHRGDGHGPTLDGAVGSVDGVALSAPSARELARPWPGVANTVVIVRDDPAAIGRVEVAFVSAVGVERMTRDDVGLALGWAANEGWNPGLHDADAFWAADPRGFFVMKVDNQPVATLAAVRYGERFGFLGLYITAPDKRGRGYGLEVWRAGRAHLGGRVVGLDAVVEQEKTYARDGFVADHRTTRHMLASTSSVPASRQSMVDARDVPLETLMAYDERVFPSTRWEFLAAWIAMPGVASVAVVDGGQVLGWAVRRPCIEGHKVGPLFANDPAIADDLLCAVAAGVTGPLYLDVPDPNAAGRALVARHGMTPVFSTIRMYDGPPPTLDLERIFGVTTLELG